MTQKPFDETPYCEPSEESLRASSKPDSLLTRALNSAIPIRARQAAEDERELFEATGKRPWELGRGEAATEPDWSAMHDDLEFDLSAAEWLLAGNSITDALVTRTAKRWEHVTNKYGKPEAVAGVDVLPDALPMDAWQTVLPTRGGGAALAASLEISVRHDSLRGQLLDLTRVCGPDAPSLCEPLRYDPRTRLLVVKPLEWLKGRS